MLIKITFFFVAIRTKYDTCEPDYEVIEGPFLSQDLAETAKDANPITFHHREWKDLVVIEVELAPGKIINVCEF